MKKFFLTLVLICGMASLYAQVEKAVQEAPASTAPEMTFDQRVVTQEGIVYDYGTIKRGSNGETYFSFTNTGKEPLIIERASSSCGCTVPNSPTYPILPGAKDSISVRYDTNRIGVINKTITVISNAANNPVIMQIKGNVVEQ
jgi:hypothetical protein